MNLSKQIGIFMNYSTAHIMEFSEKPNEIGIIESKFESKFIKEKNKGENYLYSLAKQCKSDYFKKIASTILEYDKVLLFGPTCAKTELFNMLCENDLFFKVEIFLEETGSLTQKQRNKYIHEYFACPTYE
jgi:hypothetical protein